MNGLFFLLLVLLLHTAPARAGADGADEPEDAPLLQLSADQDGAAGLVLTTLQSIDRSEEITATGQVLDIQPLLTLRARYQAALADVALTRAALTLAERDRNRVAALNREQIVAGRVLIEAETRHQGDAARHQAATRQVTALHNEAIQTLGQELARRVLTGQDGLLDDWIHQRRVLILVSLPQGLAVPLNFATVQVSRELDRPTARAARLLSSAPATDALTQGETFYYHAAAEGLRSGMRLQVWIPTRNTAKPAVLLPYRAVVWQDGKAWVYRQDVPRHYARVEIHAHQDYGPDWLVNEGLEPGDRVVVSGAQTLLSESLKRQIPAEDDD
jgi:hypothetical protein